MAWELAGMRESASNSVLPLAERELGLASIGPHVKT